jgi:hypothetical protein
MIRIHTDCYPFVLLHLGAAPRSADALRLAFGEIHEINVRAQRTGTRHVIIAMAHDYPNAGERKLIAECSNGLAPWEIALCVMSVVVIPNGLMRGALTALSWLIPNMAPLDSAATSDRAIELAGRHLRKHGIAYDRGDADAAARWLRDRQRAVPEKRLP